MTICCSQVYDLFELYTKYIRQHGLYDEGDILFNVYNRLKPVQHECRQSWVIHEVSVSHVLVGGSIFYIFFLTILVSHLLILSVFFWFCDSCSH